MPKVQKLSTPQVEVLHLSLLRICEINSPNFNQEKMSFYQSIWDVVPVSFVVRIGLMCAGLKLGFWLWEKIAEAFKR